MQHQFIRPSLFSGCIRSWDHPPFCGLRPHISPPFWDCAVTKTPPFDVPGHTPQVYFQSAKFHSNACVCVKCHVEEKTGGVTHNLHSKDKLYNGHNNAYFNFFGSLPQRTSIPYIYNVHTPMLYYVLYIFVCMLWCPMHKIYLYVSTSFSIYNNNRAEANMTK